MLRRSINAPEAPRTTGLYSQAVEVSGATRFLHVSGQIPVSSDGSVPVTFREQAELTWRNVTAQVKAADMSISNIIKVTTFLGDRQYAEDNSAVRREALGDVSPALTVIICQIYDPAWFLEIEVTAAA